MREYTVQSCRLQNFPSSCDRTFCVKGGCVLSLISYYKTVLALCSIFLYHSSISMLLGQTVIILFVSVYLATAVWLD